MTAKLNGWLVVTLLLGTMAYAIAEELTLTTYYPSPRGVYNELRTRGDVAIGKLDSPSARLEVVGGGATSATSALRIKNVDQTPLLEVRNDGNVGIGTTNPSQKLHVVGNAMVESGQLRVATLSGDPSALGNGAIYYNTTTNKFRGYRAGSWQDLGEDSDWVISGENMYSGVPGNVGIGTSSPEAKLDVNGAIRMRSGYFQLPALSSPPSPAADGMVYFDAGSKTFKGYQKGQWLSLRSEIADIPLSWVCGGPGEGGGTGITCTASPPPCPGGLFNAGCLRSDGYRTCTCYTEGVTCPAVYRVCENR